MKYIKYIFGIVIVILISLIMVLIYNDKITQNSPVYYKQGIEFYNNGDYQNAYYNFGKIKWISPLYPMAIFRQAKSAQKVGDYNTAIIKYRLFLKKSPSSVFAANAQQNLAKCYFYLKNYEEAKLEFEKLNDEYKDYMPQIDYFLGIIEKNYNKEASIRYFKEYLNKALIEKSITSEYVISAADELKSLILNPDDKELKLLGIAYFKGNKYEESLKYFSKLQTENCWDYMVLANHYAGNKLIAKKLIESGLRQYSFSTDKENLKSIYKIYTSYMNSSKINNWYKMYVLAKEYSLNGEDYVMYKYARLLSEEKALTIYNEIMSKFPNSDYAPESMWEVFWANYKAQNYAKAKEIAINHIKTFENVNSTPKIMFWLAKIEQKENKNSEFHSILSKLAGRYPDNYYGLRALSIINKDNNFFNTNKSDKINITKTPIDFPISLSEIEIKDLKLINTLFSMGDYEIWPDANFQSDIVSSWFEYKKGQKAKSIILAEKFIKNSEIKPPIISEAYKLAYPIYFPEEINIASKKLNIDAYLILSIIREESHFNELARSSTNAIGLMQLLPLTANYMMTKLDNEITDDLNLEEPKLNLYLGCHYLKYLYDRFNNDLYVVAAYNGGEGSVNKWSKSIITSDIDEFIEKIPYEETRTYIKKIFKSYNMYKVIYK